MSGLDRFEKYRGSWIAVSGSNNSFYVPKEDEEDFFVGVTMDMDFDRKVAEGWTVVAIAACFEDGEPVQSEGLLAVHFGQGTVIESDEGSLRDLGQVSELQIEVVEPEDDDNDEDD